MSRIFIGYSSFNNDKAKEVVDWLTRNGWPDVFLDLDPERGIAASQRWKEALQKAASRCEVVLALVSKGMARLGLVQVGDRRRAPHGQEGDRGARRRREERGSARPHGGTGHRPCGRSAGLLAPERGIEARRPRSNDFSVRSEPPALSGLRLSRRGAGRGGFLRKRRAIVRGLDEIRGLARAGVTRMLVILGDSGTGTALNYFKTSMSELYN